MNERSTAIRYGLPRRRKPSCRDWLEDAHRKAQAEGLAATDDAFLMEWMGYPVRVVEGSGENIKVTRPEDLVIGEAILASRVGHTP